MVRAKWGRRLAPILLGAGMLGTVVAAGLSPTLGAVAAQSNCQYSQCQASTAAPFPWWIVVVIVVVVLAVLIALLLLRRRPPAASTAAPEAWQPPEGAAGGGPMAPSAAPVVVAGVAAAPAAAYVETPEDVGQSLPAVAAGAAAGGAAGAATGEGEQDIDSLMAELDKISGEILKKAPKTGTGGSGAGEAADETTR
jgi:H+/Cl- antiporter ClcA